jgi:hypothetical protein
MGDGEIVSLEERLSLFGWAGWKPALLYGAGWEPVLLYGTGWKPALLCAYVIGRVGNPHSGGGG